MLAESFVAPTADSGNQDEDPARDFEIALQPDWRIDESVGSTDNDSIAADIASNAGDTDNDSIAADIASNAGDTDNDSIAADIASNAGDTDN
ncbi:hypothetical protein AB0O90_03895, partial [Microbacterium testaceum]|uniref:hypothetical protein n=1 Tax=Microbacterium testaceum TaxID=2033 RepID=UPI00341DAB0C